MIGRATPCAPSTRFVGQASCMSPYYSLRSINRIYKPQPEKFLKEFMSIELKVPEIGESITEVEIGGWLIKAGDAVKKDEPVVTLESEKATVELPSPGAGTIGKLLKQKGDIAKVGEVIGYLEEGQTDGAEKKPDAKAPEAKAPEPKPAEKPKTETKQESPEVQSRTGFGFIAPSAKSNRRRKKPAANACAKNPPKHPHPRNAEHLLGMNRFSHPPHKNPPARPTARKKSFR